MSGAPRRSSIPLSPNPEHRRPKDIAKRRRDHLRHIHQMTHEHQLALVEEARVARTREQKRVEQTQP
jgi:hypothetical protein